MNKTVHRITTFFALFFLAVIIWGLAPVRKLNAETNVISSCVEIDNREQISCSAFALSDQNNELSELFFVPKRGEKMLDVFRNLAISQSRINEINNLLDGRLSSDFPEGSLLQVYLLEGGDRSHEKEIGRISIYSSRVHQVTLAKADDGQFVKLTGRGPLELKLCSATKKDIRILYNCTIHYGTRDKIVPILN